jgi:hypothetical protein
MRAMNADRIEAFIAITAEFTAWRAPQPTELQSEIRGATQEHRLLFLGALQIEASLSGESR